MQEVILRLLRALLQPDKRIDDLLQMASTVAFTTICEYCRRRNRRPCRCMGDCSHLPHTTDGDVRYVEALDHYLTRLPAPVKEVVIEMCINGHSEGEVIRRLGLTEDELAVRIRIAKQSLLDLTGQ